ncbi:AraC family transcriptional regulator [Paenibacillus methanolicus]|uniref:AraC-like DNA-binding protein n=1 Tax=Paenibacillus methanolicus TaxID=582686 RepID=A0A5S5CFP9_9BACL|nr:AraC family transcriptional regulator [Paenibacillus methanolicus]TYP78117.1 AraC-like DNA-binding protein [Paenibacillus methanolicus]
MKEYGHELAAFCYYAPSAFEKLGGLWPIRSGHNIAKAGYAVGPRMIECYSLHVVLDGNVEFQAGEARATLRRGDLFCLFPDRLHNYRAVEFAADSPLRLHWLAFDGPQAEELLARVGITAEEPYLRGKANGELTELLTRQFGWMTEGNRPVELQMSLYRLFALLAPSDAPDSSGSVEPGWLERSAAYMKSHYMEPITVADAARQAGVHRSHFYLAFQRRYGMSPKRYLIQLRMEKAEELLRIGKLTVTEIALSLGYADLYAFSRAFGQFHGIAPSAYRQGRRGGPADG